MKNIDIAHEFFIVILIHVKHLTMLATIKTYFTAITQ